MIVITFNTLAKEGDDLIKRQPSPEARRLWNALFAPYSGNIAIIADGIEKIQILTEWLKREGYKASIVDFTHEKGSEPIFHRVQALHAVYGRIHWFIDVDPATIAKVAHEGIPTLLVTVPDTVRPEWNGANKVPKSWETLVEELDNQALARAERTWGDTE